MRYGNPNRSMRLAVRVACSLAISVSELACGNEETVDPGVGLLFDGSWTRGWPQLGHDGQQYEGTNFIVYSERSSQAARMQLAEIGESVLAEIKTQLTITHDDFDFLPSYVSEKIHVMADYNQMARSGMAYRDGIIIRAIDSPRYAAAGYTPASYRALMHHELTHVVEFLLIGNPTYQQANHVWLREGFANYNSGPRASTITTVEEVEAWREEFQNVPGGGNPIGVRVWSDFPDQIIQSNTTIRYYAWFELATAYLLDPAGHGKTLEDLKNFYDDLGNGRGFHTAFTMHFEMDVDVFETDFFDIVTEYLAGK